MGRALTGVPRCWVGIGSALTRENGGHEGCEHEEQHGEEEEAGVTQDLLGLVPNPQVQQADEEADSDVRRDPQVRQDLGADTVPTECAGVGQRPRKALAPDFSSRKTSPDPKPTYTHTHTHQKQSLLFSVKSPSRKAGRVVCLVCLQKRGRVKQCWGAENGHTRSLSLERSGLGSYKPPSVQRSSQRPRRALSPPRQGACQVVH